jgi:hypothetical protein
MKETMDGAENDANIVAKHILPEPPHHLSLYFDRRFPKPDDWWFRGASGALQYMTYISAGERGLLTTRAAFTWDEPPPPPPMSTKLLAKGDVKKKLSLMDYRNRIKSASPVENGMSSKPEEKINGTVHAKPLPPRDDTKKDAMRAVENTSAPRQRDAPPEKPRSEMNGERYVKPEARLWYALQRTNRPVEVRLLTRNRNPSPRAASGLRIQIRTRLLRNESKLRPATPRRASHGNPSRGHHEAGKGQRSHQEISRPRHYILLSTDCRPCIQTGIGIIRHPQDQQSRSTDRGLGQTAGLPPPGNRKA